MSISTEGESELDTFDDVIQQQVSRRTEIAESNVDQNQGGLAGGDGNEALSFEVVGENFWNELSPDEEVIAELIGYRVDFDSLEFRDNSAHTEWGSFHADTNAGLQPGREGNRVSVSDGPQDLTGDGDNEITTLQGENRRNARFLYEYRHSIYPVLFDAANATGSGGQPFSVMDSVHMDYRDMFGRGPLVDESDEVTFNAAYFANGILAQNAIEHKSGLVLWWDIYAREKAPLEDILMGR